MDSRGAGCGPRPRAHREVSFVQDPPTPFLGSYARQVSDAHWIGAGRQRDGRDGLGGVGRRDQRKTKCGIRRRRSSQHSGNGAQNLSQMTRAEARTSGGTPGDMKPPKRHPGKPPTPAVEEKKELSPRRSLRFQHADRRGSQEIAACVEDL